jgi:hypothetical protein
MTMTGSIFPRRLKLEIVFLICVKILALSALYQLFFAPTAHGRPLETKAGLVTRLFSETPDH